ncbi:PelD GGDEF domain-containing protein [Desulfurobacterium atlanticum]|uniref:PelD GGDEF domain-containing protein n=1 Tax=Desulfurobacterium atlanticum TaxID=240169 RepID=A0A238XVR4_9BACT|nr:PelD GGDEF domain-containing protein [Desulfurobacterium atlanticum]SNR62648.1 PelD GGDEF domain-containing protein [Desulfurobacterium atlanticum]
MAGNRDIAVKFVIAEAIVFAVILAGIGFYTSSKDPLFIHSSVNPFVILSLSLTLFYGLLGGLIFIAASIPAFYFLYHIFPVNFLLWDLLLVLIAGEFFFYWKKKIQLAEEENIYFKDKLRKQINDFILLKLSHDQLERHYLIKPVSIRSVLEQIRNEIVKDKRTASNKLMNLINEAFNVEEGNLYLKEKNWFKEVGYIGTSAELDTEDPLVKEALESGKTVFISSKSENTKYLAIIPIFDNRNEDEIVALFAVRKIPFRYLNADNILSINVALIWFFAELKKSESATKVIEEIPYLPLEFAAEIETLRKMNIKFGIDSYIVVFKIDREFSDLVDFIHRRIRGIDVAFFKKEKNTNKYFLFVLLPLSPLPSAEGFVNRVKKEIDRYIGEKAFQNLEVKLLKIDNYIVEHLKKFEVENE